MIRAVVIALALGTAHHSVPVFAGCGPETPQVRPSSLLVTCSGWNFLLAGLFWSRWNSTQADAKGVGLVNDCSPDCRNGRFHDYPVTVRLSRPRTCSNGRREFTRFALRFVRAVPIGQRNTSFKSPFYSGAGCP